MSWYAADELDEAWEETRDLLFPFDWRTWAKLFLIVLLTGHGVSFPNMPSSFPSDTTTSRGYSDAYGTSTTADQTLTNVAGTVPDFSMTGLATSSPTAVDSVWMLLGIAVIGLFLAFFLASSVFEFVYYQSLLDKDVSVRDNFSQHFSKGVSYFGFRLAILLLAVLAVAGLAASFFASPIAGGFLLVAAILALIPLMIFLGLTQNFVLLKMMERESGVTEAWREFWPELREEWRQVAVYIAIRFGVKIGIGVITLIWALIAFLALLVPFGVLIALFYLASPALAAIPAVIGILTWVVLLVGLSVITKTYLYNYAILVYHDLTA